MPALANKVAVVTGATSGMALATARLFVEEGAHVYITGRRQEYLDRAADELGRRVTAVPADSANLSDLDRLFATVRAGHGRIDVLYASAGGGGGSQRLGEITEEGFDKVFNLNARGTLFTVQKALPLMGEGGSIILTGSAGVWKGLQGLSVYLAAKAALRAYVRTWAAELAGQGIRVNLVSPGSTDTGALAKVPDAIKDTLAAEIPLGRLGRPEDIAAAVLFLASTNSSFITGTELFVDGGYAQI